MNRRRLKYLTGQLVRLAERYRWETEDARDGYWTPPGRWSLLGSGSYTMVFAHREFPGLVFKLNQGNHDRMREFHHWLVKQTHENLPRCYAVYHYDRQELRWDEEPYTYMTTVAIAERLGENVYEYDEFTGPAVPIIAELQPIVTGAGFSMGDIHTGNIMMRGDIIIINDPSTVCSYEYEGNSCEL